MEGFFGAMLSGGGGGVQVVSAAELAGIFGGGGGGGDKNKNDNRRIFTHLSSGSPGDAHLKAVEDLLLKGGTFNGAAFSEACGFEQVHFYENKMAYHWARIIFAVAVHNADLLEPVKTKFYTEFARKLDNTSNFNEFTERISALVLLICSILSRPAKFNRLKALNLLSWSGLTRAERAAFIITSSDEIFAAACNTFIPGPGVQVFNDLTTLQLLAFDGGSFEKATHYLQSHSWIGKGNDLDVSLILASSTESVGVLRAILAEAPSSFEVWTHDAAAFTTAFVYGRSDTL